MFGELNGVSREVEQDLAQSDGIASDGRRQLRIEDGPDRDVGGMSQQIDNAFDDFDQIKRHRFNADAASLDSGGVENIVDDAEEGVGGCAGVVTVVPLLRRQWGGQKQLDHAHHPVHGSSDLMAHHGEELGLRPVRPVGFLP